MTSRCLDIASISRYLYRLAELEDILHVEGHVGHCARCREKLQRMKHYTETLFDEHDADADGESCCPSLIALEHFRRDGLQERQMIRIQSHLRDCSICRDWIRQRQPPAAPWEIPAATFPTTRTPDVDLRIARQGVRVAAGAVLLDLDVIPNLLQRLDLPDPGKVAPIVTIHRSLHFRFPEPERNLRGRVDFLGYEGFRLTLRASCREQEHSLCLWTRNRLQQRWRIGVGGGEVSWLLMPGHYFVGAMPEDEPLLALSVEPELLSPQALAACGYEACRAGRFTSAQSCFEQASRLARQSPYGIMQRRTQALARRFGLADGDADLAWQPVQQPWRQPESPPPVSLGRGDEDAEAIVQLVESLRRHEGEPNLGVGAVPVVVSRQRFRPAFASLMRRHWADLHATSISVESPIPCS